MTLSSIQANAALFFDGWLRLLRGEWKLYYPALSRLRAIRYHPPSHATPQLIAADSGEIPSATNFITRLAPRTEELPGKEPFLNKCLEQIGDPILKRGFAVRKTLHPTLSTGRLEISLCQQDPRKILRPFQPLLTVQITITQEENDSGNAHVQLLNPLNGETTPLSLSVSQPNTEDLARAILHRLPIHSHQ